MNTWRYVDSDHHVVTSQDGVRPHESHSVESYEILNYLKNGGIIDPEPHKASIPLNLKGVTLYSTVEPPTPLAGEAFIFLDKADGYVKVKYSNGQVEGFLNTQSKASTKPVE